VAFRAVRDDGKRVIVLVNTTGAAQKVTLGLSDAGETVLSNMSGVKIKASDATLTLDLKPFEAVALSQ
jgi:hypothetical protein